MYLIFILLGGLFLRLYGINWDLGFHLHPDERELMLVADQLHFFSQMNPHFFNYGTLPLYILRGVSQLWDTLFFTQLANYSGMLLIGRVLSVLFDMGTMILILKIAQRLFKNEKISMAATFFYAIAFFPIQNSHFFVVDVSLNFFITLLFYELLLLLEKFRWQLCIAIGITYAATLATKITVVIFLPVILFLFFIVMMKKTKYPFYNFGQFTILTIIFLCVTVLFHFIFMPYAYLAHQEFLAAIFGQLQMNSNPYIFPYTLQYVYTQPYLYYIKNIFLWGLGPVISIISLIGLISLVKNIYKKEKPKISKKQLLVFFEKNKFLLFFLFFYLFYFIIIGKSSVKFMRYMLPLYPMLTILAGYGFMKIQKLVSKFANTRTLTISIMIIALVWTVSFVNMYSFQHTRIAATNWILQHIPQGSHIAIEHWDDQLPLVNTPAYQFNTLTIYDLPDNQSKWNQLNQKIMGSDYIIIASNRLYVPLQKLSDCSKYKICYPLTAQYYQKLFKGQLPFKKVVEFAVSPTIPFTNIHINDQSADESFTVYDHPKIIIFKKL